MKKIIAFFILSSVKILSQIFYRHELTWINGKPFQNVKQYKVLILLNHTSLFEPLFLANLPMGLIWHFAKNLVACGADITLERPVIGYFWRYLAPEMISITRKRDETWDLFIQKVQNPDSIILMAPEGRMMREDGLDKHGNPMSVRGGVVDVLDQLDHGDLVILYSGGLHHVHTPGDSYPKLFKKIKMAAENIPIKEYKNQFANLSDHERRIAITRELEERMSKNIPN